jgi:Raf kinase inhibitor-like YbhB/YbcL family protein
MSSFALKSEAFTDGQPLPANYTGDGADVSPPLSWDKPPDGTVELALICEDSDAPGGNFVHWVAWGLPATTTSLKEGVKPSDPGVKQGRNDFGATGYKGPAPPKGKVHHYRFRLLALSQKLALTAGADKTALRQATQEHVLGEGVLVGTYQR